MSKVKSRIQLLSNGFMFRKLFAIIRGNSVNRLFHMRQQSHDSLSDGGGRPSFHMRYQSVHRLALVQGDQGLLMAFADDGIHLPVTDACLPVHNLGALINTDLIHQRPTALIATITLLTFFLTTQVSVQLATLCLDLV